MADDAHESVQLEAYDFIVNLASFNPFGVVLEVIIERKGIDRRELARAIGKSADAVESWMRGSEDKRLPSGKSFYRLAWELRLFALEEERLDKLLQATRRAHSLVQYCRTAYESGDFDAILVKKREFKRDYQSLAKDIVAQLSVKGLEDLI